MAAASDFVIYMKEVTVNRIYSRNGFWIFLR
jgi:hypothetical protein